MNFRLTTIIFLFLQVKMGSLCENPKRPYHTFRNSIYPLKKQVSFTFFFLQTWIEYSPYRTIVCFELGIFFFFFFSKANYLACSLQKKKNNTSEKGLWMYYSLFDLLKTSFRLTALIWCMLYRVCVLFNLALRVQRLLSSSSCQARRHIAIKAIQHELSVPFAYYFV